MHKMGRVTKAGARERFHFFEANLKHITVGPSNALYTKDEGKSLAGQKSKKD
jgi:hypothetical protein